MLDEKQLPILSTALMRLRGDTLSSIGTATGIRAANLSVWLRGKEQVISAKRVAGLLYHLGLEGGHLRTDVLHHWHDTGPLDDAKTVLDLLTKKDTPLWLFQDAQPGLTKTRYIRTGDAWVKLELTPGIADAKDLADVISAKRLLTLPVPLASIPTHSLQAASHALLDVATAEVDVGDEELLEGLIFKLSEKSAANLTFNTSYPGGWVELEKALEFALMRGIDPGDIALLIRDNYNKSTG